MKKQNKPNKAEIIKSDQEAHCNTFKNTEGIFSPTQMGHFGKKTQVLTVIGS